MRIKQNSAKQIQGIPSARAVVAGGEDGQAKTVNVFVSALDAYDIPTMAFSLRLTPQEARDLAARLLKEAGV